MVIRNSLAVCNIKLMNSHVLQAYTEITRSHISVHPQFQLAGNNHALNNEY